MKNPNQYLKKLILAIILTTFMFITFSSSSGYEKNEFSAGIVEGFYGKPWSAQDRIEMISFMARNKFNFYIYGPKDDAYHRGKWKLNYPQEKLKELKNLINHCKKNNIKFCFALSPGLSIVYSDKSDLNLLINKYKVIYELGVRDFAIFLDDIPQKLIHKKDIITYKTLENAHVNFVNFIYREIKSWNNENTLLFVPTQYHGLTATPYLVTIGKSLNKNIPICWTGRNIVSKSITEDDLKKIKKIVDRKIFIWDNYPVNDFQQNILFLGPILNRTSSIKNYVSVYAANPMNQPQASKIPLLTISYWLNNLKSYNPINALKNAINKFGGNTNDSLSLFVELFDKTRLTESGNSTLSKILNIYYNEIKNTGKPGFKTEKNLLQLLDIYKNMETGLGSIGNTKFISEIKPWLIKIKYLSLSAFYANKIWNNPDDKSSYNKLLINKEKYTRIPLTLGDFQLEEFIEKAIKKHKIKTGDYTINLKTSIKETASYPLDFIFDNDNNTFFLSKSRISQNAHVTISFNTNRLLKYINIKSSALGYHSLFITNAILEYSLDSNNYISLGKVKGREITVTFSNPKQIKHLRLRFIKNSSSRIAIREIILR